MDQEWVGIVAIVSVLALILAGFPLAFAFMIAGMGGIWYLAGSGPALSSLAMTPFTWASNYVFMAIPLFVFMGHLAFRSGLSKDLYDFGHKLIGHVRGGLGIASVIGCGFFGAVSGSSLATAAAMGSVALPEMRKRGYDVKLATGCVAAGGTLGMLIPPSVGFIVYGMIASQNVGKLFMAGILPGVVVILLYSIGMYIMVRRNPRLAPSVPPSSWGERARAVGKIWPVILIFLFIMGGIYFGVFTPTEAGAFGVLGVFVFFMARRGANKRQSLVSAIRETGSTTAMIFLLIIGAMMFNLVMVRSGLPVTLAELIADWDVPRYLVIAAMMLLYVPLGCFMEATGMMVLTVPIFLPVIQALGFDGIWFGVMLIRMIEVGLITPPLGMNVFVISGVAPDIRLTDIFRGIVPFLIMDLISVAILAAFPIISVFLPNLMT